MIYGGVCAPPYIGNRGIVMLRKAYLEITNICNLACSFCPGTKREKSFMSAENFSLLASKLRPHTQYLYLHLMGEPLLHPDLEQLLDITEKLGFKVIITTNGTLLEKRAELLLSAKSVHKINISLQSFEANSRGVLDEYIRTCAEFARSASENGKICVLRLWNNNGLDSLNEQIELILSEYFPRPWRESRGSRALADKLWLEPGDKFDWPDLGTDDRGESCFCYGLRDQIGVLCDGTVVPCCLDHEGDIALGNLFEQELDEILNSPRARAIYDGFSRRQAVEELCRRCGYARRFT